VNRRGFIGALVACIPGVALLRRARPSNPYWDEVARLGHHPTGSVTVEHPNAWWRNHQTPPIDTVNLNLVRSIMFRCKRDSIFTP